MNTRSGADRSRELALAFARFGPSFGKWMAAGAKETTIPRLHLLQVLHRGGPQIMSALGDHLGVTARNVTVLVDGLEREGLARRTPHPQDRRATIVELTDKGQRMIGDAFEEHIERVSVLFERLSERERASLIKIISKLTDELIAMGVSPVCGPMDGPALTAAESQSH